MTAMLERAAEALYMRGMVKGQDAPWDEASAEMKRWIKGHVSAVLTAIGMPDPATVERGYQDDVRASPDPLFTATIDHIVMPTPDNHPSDELLEALALIERFRKDYNPYQDDQLEEDAEEFIAKHKGPQS